MEKGGDEWREHDDENTPSFCNHHHFRPTPVPTFVASVRAAICLYVNYLALRRTCVCNVFPLLPQVLHALDEVYLLFRQHPGEDLAALDYPVEERLVVVPDEGEGAAVAGEHVVLLLDRLDEVGLEKRAALVARS